jgi:K+-transporting ATPase ATPase C chain
MKKQLLTAVLMTMVTTVLLGLVYPLVLTGIAELRFPAKANGSLLQKNGKTIGSRLIGQPFTGPGYFHSRPSTAGDAGYDPRASGGSNLGPTNRKLISRVEAAVVRLKAEDTNAAVPVDLITTSASGLDPDISPAAAEFQISRVARERSLSPDEVRRLVEQHTTPRDLGLLREPRVNVLELNLALDEKGGRGTAASQPKP